MRNAVMLLMVLGTMDIAHAQEERVRPGVERAGVVYVIGEIQVPWLYEPSGHDTSKLSSPNAPAPGGFAPGWGGGGGVFVGTRMSIEGFFSRTGRVWLTQPDRYLLPRTWHLWRRDTGYAALVRYHVFPRRLVDLEAVAGFEIVRRDAWGWWTDNPAPRDAPPPDDVWAYHPLDAVRGVVAGVDARLGRGRIALIPSFRLHRTFTPKGHQVSSIFPGGVSEWTLTPGVIMRLHF